MGGNGFNKISKGLKAVTYLTTPKQIKGTTAQTSIIPLLILFGVMCFYSNDYD